MNPSIVAFSAAMRAVLEQVDTVARTDATVLICGETGTGKELIARALHARGRRAPRDFVRMSCAAVPAGLFEAELFGHERGAFTGAIAPRAGRFERADGGTLFLDEVGELPLELQPKLLRVIQEREFERLGGSQIRVCDVRLVAATHRDLRRMVEDHAFREDLYYRLDVFPILLPPLRDRRDDIAPLARHIVERLCAQLARPPVTITARTMARLERHPWPGNVRELQNALERALILCAGPELEVHVPADNTMAAARSMELDDIARAHIASVLRATNGVIAGPRGAAALLGMKRTTLNFRMKKLGIERRRPPSERAHRPHLGPESARSPG